MNNAFRNGRVLTIILGGGRGVRLYPLTKERCKAAVPLGGRYRMIDIPMSNCINSQLHHIFLMTQYLGRSLQRHISQTYRFDQFSDGFVEVLSAEQTSTDFMWYEGTADAVRKNLSRIERFRAENVLILSADHLYRMDYRNLIDYHLARGADCTISATLCNSDDASRMGILRADHGTDVHEFVEKPKDAALLNGLEYDPQKKGNRRYLASMGIYIFRKGFLIDLLKGSGAPDFGNHIIPEAIQKGKVCVYQFDGYWMDVGTIEAFFNANLDFTSPLPPFDFYSTHARVFTRPRFLPPAKLMDCRVSRSVIAEGSVIEGAKLTECVIGIRSVIQRKCQIKQSIIMGNDYYQREYDTGFIRPMIGSNTVIERAIVDKNVVIGDNVVIRGSFGPINEDAANYHIRDGIVVVPSNAFIPSGTQICADARAEQISEAVDP